MKKGFTLIEAMIVTALLSIMVAVVVVVFSMGLKTWDSGRNRTEIREKACLAMERMVRDLNQASTITAATASAITFAADVNNDAISETVTFALDANSNLVRTMNGTSVTLTPNAQALTFSYTDLNNNSIVPVTQTARNSIRIVTIALTMNKANETYALNSSAYTRNQIL